MFRIINREFRKHGLSLRGEAAEAIKEFLSARNADETSSQKYLDSILKQVKEQGLPSAFVDLKTINTVLSSLEEEKIQTTEEFIRVIDAFDTPKYRYARVRKVFNRIPVHSQKTLLHGNASSKAHMYRDRYQLLHQRLLRQDLFSPPPVSAGPAAKKEYYEITQIESLMGQKGRKCIFGMLTQLTEGKYYIEDLDASVPIDLSQANLTAGLFTDNCFVLAEGEYVDGVFVVSTLGFPLPEVRSDTLTAHPQLDQFGLDPKPGSDREKERVAMEARLKARGEDDMMVMLSDIYLDVPKVMEKLRELLSGYAAVRPVPSVFVLMGNFTSKPYGHAASDMKKLKGYFDALADLISKFQDLMKSVWVFVPGPTDIGVGAALPRPSLPALLTTRLKERLGRVVFASNPCRILYYGLEIVLFREDLLHKMRRNCVLPPSESETADVTEHLAKTVCDQAHLSPLPLVNRPMYWNFDHALRLYPLPHLLVLGDVVEQYEWNYEGCATFNPGSFSTDSSFLVYYPVAKRTEFSRID